MGAARTRLVHLAAVAERSNQAERRIHDAAVDRRSIVERELQTLRPRVNLDDAAAERYQALILERGQLDTVIASAQARGAGSDAAT